MCWGPFAAYLSTDAAHLLKALLQREVPKRLGFGVDGSERVMKHPFFKHISWERLMNQEVCGGLWLYVIRLFLVLRMGGGCLCLCVCVCVRVCLCLSVCVLRAWGRGGGALVALSGS
jgi:hypothetical protein